MFSKHVKSFMILLSLSALIISPFSSTLATKEDTSKVRSGSISQKVATVFWAGVVTAVVGIAYAVLTSPEPVKREFCYSPRKWAGALDGKHHWVRDCDHSKLPDPSPERYEESDVLNI